MPEKQKRLGSTAITLMVLVALFYDGLQVVIQLVPILGQILSSLISMFALMTFYLWFKIKGLNFTNPKRMGYLGGGFFIELIPILNILPAWTLTIVLLTLDSKIKKSFKQSDIIEA